MHSKSAGKISSFWQDLTVLVTGGAGFIGSWLSCELVRRGAKVVILDVKDGIPYRGEPADSFLKKAVYVKGDVRDERLLSSLRDRYHPQIVFHLAAKAIVGEALEDPAEALDTNIMGTVRMLETFRKSKTCRHIVVASSDKAYGVHDSLPYQEESALKGEDHPYDCSKASADMIARMYAKVYGTPVSVVRCGNVFGGGDLNFSRLIPDSIRSFLSDTPVRIRSNGQYKRDYIYIKDIVSAYISTAEKLSHGNMKGEAFNFGHNRPLRVLEVVEVIAKISGKTHLAPIILNEAKHEIEHQYLDASKATRVLGWRPHYTIETGMKETLEWYKNFFKRAEA